MQIIKSPRVFMLAAIGAVIALGVPQAAAQGQALQHSPRLAAASRAAASPQSLKWVREAIAEGRAQHASTKLSPTTSIGNFSQCPALPTGDDPAFFACFLIHITGGVLDLGNSHQVINKTINISFGQGADPSGNTVFLIGTLKTRPMPVLGGIFLDPLVNNIVGTDPNLQLSVRPVQVTQAPDPTGNTALFISQVIRAINPVFGSTCRVGTTQTPLVLDPTFGTTSPPPPNQPESGHVDSIEQVGNELVIIGTVVDNAFAAPSAAGCGPSDSLNNVVNEVGGLPSPAGTNNAVFQVTVELTGYSNV
jgi:hypothetical protein